MDTLTESAFAALAKAGGIEKLYAIPQQNGCFLVQAKLMWKDERATLITQKKRPREWANLNNLIFHIQTNHEKIKEVIVEINKE